MNNILRPIKGVIHRNTVSIIIIVFDRNLTFSKTKHHFILIFILVYRLVSVPLRSSTPLKFLEWIIVPMFLQQFPGTIQQFLTGLLLARRTSPSLLNVLVRMMIMTTQYHYRFFGVRSKRS